MTKLRWTRQSSNSANLVLVNPQDLDANEMRELLKDIQNETHRGVTLNQTAIKEFERWFGQPNTPLKSGAYVLLSNWFPTGSGDRDSTVAARCEKLWDALFPCRPLNRLSSPNLNYKILRTKFEAV